MLTRNQNKKFRERRKNASLKKKEVFQRQLNFLKWNVEKTN